VRLIVSCSYCGKVIGAFRLLRDSEFCCDLHRRQYGERLDKALHELASPEPAPTGIAGFLDEMPFQPGNRSSTLIPWQTTAVRGRIRTGNHWPLTLDTSQAMSGTAAVCECDPVEFPQHSERWLPDAAPALTLRVPDFTAELDPTPFLDLMSQAPARCDKWMHAPAPEPVAAFVRASAELEPADAPHVLRFGTELNPTPFLDLAPQAPARCHKWMPVPAPEPVAAFVRASTALATRADTPHFLRFAAELDPTPCLDLAPYTLPAYDNWVPIPAPEPVAAFVQASVAPTPAYALHTLLFTAELEHDPPLDANLAACNLRMPGFAAAEACGAPADAQGVEPSAAPPQMPVPEFNAELEPLPMLDAPLTPPAMCQRWMPAAAAADPVFGHLRTSMAPSVAVPPAMKAPAFGISVVAPRVARVDQTQPMPSAEEVMAVAATNGSKAPPAWIHPAAAMALPAVPPADQELFGAARPASTRLPEAVELPPVDTQASEPVAMPHAPLCNAELGAVPEFLEAAPAMGKAASISSPTALESVPVASVAAPVALAAPVRLPPFRDAASQEHRLPDLAAQRLTPEVHKPAAVGPRLVAPEPIATLAVTPPFIDQRQVETGLPRPGLLSLEYHSQRQRHVPTGRPEWRTPRPALYPPPFLLSPVLEKLGEPAPVQRAARPGFGKLRTMPAVKRPSSTLMIAGRIAAGFLLATALWVGVANFRGDRRLIAQEEAPSVDVVPSPGNRAGAAQAPNGGTPAHAPTGPVAWMRRTIANRAALRIGDGFRSMENWDGEAQARPAGWTRHADGYVNTGALALFHPSLKFTDFRLEFFGQIETKSIGWTVHAANTMNYHAMKLTVVEAGMRPFVALVHYNVVGGKSGHRTQTPLNIMVHNNRPMQIAVDVRGSSVVTSIDGEEVDSFIDNTLVAGGVGFFSDAGERARLFWMRVSRNDDWLGHVCAMLANGAKEGSTAGLRGPRLPDGAPAPRLPGDGNEMAVAGVWIALPYLRATRKTRFFKTWRSDPWNTQAEATRTACPCRRA
jgi:hypothetical protein